MKSSVEILEIIRNNNKVTRQNMADILGITIDGVDWNIRKLRKEGKLKRIGPDKGGHWEID